MLAFALFMVGTAHTALGMEWRECRELGLLFHQADLHGTFVLYDAGADCFIGHDRERAVMRFPPASTFKIPHTLFGLAAGAVPDVDSPLSHHADGGEAEDPPLVMNLRDAIAASRVPVYQELARRIGMPAMRRFLRELDYGNADAGDAIDSFWLDGPLAVSAVEQTQFLSLLALDALPFSRVAMESVRDIVRIEKGSGGELFGKTGATGALGWWVGWVRRDDGRVYCFALNIDITGEADYPKRIELGRRCLSALVVW